MVGTLCDVYTDLINRYESLQTSHLFMEMWLEIVARHFM